MATRVKLVEQAASKKMAAMFSHEQLLTLLDEQEKELKASAAIELEKKLSDKLVVQRATLRADMEAEEALRSKEKKEEKNLWRRILFGDHLITVMSCNVSIIFLVCIAYLFKELRFFCLVVIFLAATKAQ
jgi:hypothetical protein